MFAAVLRQEVAWFDRDENSSGAITARLATDATVVRGLVGDRLSLVTQTLALIAISFAIGFALNWRLAFVILATYPLIVASSVCQQVMLKGFAIDASKNYEQSSQVASEAVSNMRTVAAFSAEDKVLALFNSHLAGPLQRAFKRGQIAGIGFGSGQFALFASFGLALWYAGQLVSQGHGEFGQVLKVFMVMIVSAFAIGEALGLAPEVAKGSSALQSVFGLLDRRPAIDAEDPKAKSLATVTGTIDLSHVTFRYPSRPDVTVFNDFSLHVPAGRTVALVGQSGSGKSTIVSLVERFYDPLEGVVRIDGHDIRTLHLRALRRQIGLVSQEPTLFATTIKANIAYGRDNATEAEIVEAARSANAHTFISSLPDGYNTQVGERGVQMSGGQKQRIAIARAVLKDPRILLLDEATSALDSESEKVVQEALDRLMVGRTTVVVAHRLSTIRNADQIAVLAEGKIVEIGSHDKLIAKGEGGAYWSLVNLQNKT
jgi:ATP-binding cassette subfamily B (MDR/TAP) protein 1